jgi:hypothetical protein
MTRDEYTQHVEALLAGHTGHAATKLAAALALVPPKARKVNIQISVDQDGEGFLDVRIALEGPDSFVLNKAVAPHAELFGTRMTAEGLDPALPLMEPGDEEFSVHDALTDCAALWIASVWKEAGITGFHLPIAIVSHDGYGTTTPIQLN